MKNLVAFPIFLIVFILQTAIFSRINLLAGAADLVLLTLVSWALQEQVRSSWHWAGLAALLAGFLSGLPPYVSLISYLFAVALARFLLRQVWQMPLLALLTVVFFSTLFSHLVSYLALWVTGVNIPLEDALAQVTLPALFLNLLFILPVHSLLRDLARWVYPQEALK